MKQPPRMNATQTALARGLAVLTSPTSGNGETFRVRGVTATFAASLTSQVVPDGIGGRILETILVAPRSAFTSLPSEGTVFETVPSGTSYRYIETHPGAGGFVNIVVRSEGI